MNIYDDQPKRPKKEPIQNVHQESPYIELNEILAKQIELDEAVMNLRIKISGCFNSCGQHHIADLGFYGNSRTFKGYKVPHFQVVLGGKWTENAGSFGMAMGAVPSKNIPKVVIKLTEYYVDNHKSSNESFQEFYSNMKSVYVIHSINNYRKFSKSVYNMLDIEPLQSGKQIDNHIQAMEHADLTIAINYESEKLMDKLKKQQNLFNKFESSLLIAFNSISNPLYSLIKPKNKKTLLSNLNPISFFDVTQFKELPKLFIIGRNNFL